MPKSENKNIYLIISKRIKEERKKLNLTQEELAEKINMSYKYLSNIERNVDKPSLDLLIRLSEELKISVISLFADNKKDNKNKVETKKDEFFRQLRYLTSDLNNKQQKEILNIIKGAKKLLK